MEGIATHVPDTPSPKKNRVGGLGSSLYGKIALDLSWPNPLQGGSITIPLGERVPSTYLDG